MQQSGSDSNPGAAPAEPGTPDRAPDGNPDSAPPTLRAALASAAPAVRRYLFGMGASWHDAEDLAQEAVLRALRGSTAFDGRASAQTWLFRIARNCYLDAMRSGKRRESFQREQAVIAAGPTSHADGLPGAGPPAALARAELAQAVARAVQTLPDEQREALALRESGGLTFAEVAELLGVSPNTVKSRVRYALLKLADELQAFAPERTP